MIGTAGSSHVTARFAEWLGLPYRWLRGVLRNQHDVWRVIDLTQFKTVPTGLVDAEHPWVTGINPDTNAVIWPENVIYRSPRGEHLNHAISDDAILMAVGRFLAHRVKQSSTSRELPQGVKRRMPHVFNYMHGASHYNSGIILLNNLREGYQHFTDRSFQREVRRFVEEERREVLILFREREYALHDYACFSCCLRLTYSYFCNPNGPQGNVLWGNFSPFPAANMITGAWANDVYALLKPGGASTVIRSSIPRGRYFQNMGELHGRSEPIWPERLLAKYNDYRVRLRGARAGLRFVDRTKVYRDQIDRKRARGETDNPLPTWTPLE